MPEFPDCSAAWAALTARREEINRRSTALNRQYDRAPDGSPAKRQVLADMSVLQADRLALEADEAALSDQATA